MKESNEFEEAILKYLEMGKVDKTFLRSFSSKILNLRKQGLVIDGVEPYLDRVIIKGTVDPNFWSKFHSLGFEFRHFETFPYGIINPEGFRFKGTIR